MTQERTHASVLADMTGPGGPYELVEDVVEGRTVRNFATRQRSLREKVEQAANFGDLEFLVQGERRLSYGELARLVWGTAHNLEARGFQRGDRLAILAFNSIDWIIAMFAATALGGVVVGLNGWWVEDELEFALNDSGSAFLVVDRRLYPRVENLLDRIPTLQTVLYLGDSPPANTVPLAEMIAPSDRVPDTPIDEGDPFVILYTSGTTGRPKGCITTHRGTIAQVAGILLHSMVGTMLGGASPLPADGSQPAALLTAPMFHVAGLHTGLCTAMTVGAKIVLSEGKFDPDAVMALIERERITTWAAVPTMLHRVVFAPTLGDYDLSTLTRISVGGAPTPPETFERARTVLPVTPSLTNGYGMTETHGIIMFNGGADLEGRPTAAGRPLPFFDIRIVDENGDDVADGALGEIVLSGPTVTPGYWNNPEATAATIVDGWLHTGDIAYRDAEGFYYIVDRAKDVIIRGGENVYSVEVENCLAQHPDIDEAAVVGVPDPALGERVKAVIHRHAGAALDEAGVREHVGAHLASFKVPEIIEFVDAPLPRNPAGKIMKNLLRGEGASAFAPDAAH